MRLDLRGELKPPPGELVASYGGGVNSVAGLVLLHRHGLRPRAIVMTNPGDEWRHTMRYLDEVTRPFCARAGFPDPVVITRAEEGQYRPRAWRLETLHDECVRIKALPSIAYFRKKCSQKYKGETQRWWAARQPWAQELWANGGKIVKVIGYDIDERHRQLSAFADSWERERFVPWYPLVDAGLGRDDCERLIADAGLPVPGKSACTFCPSNTLAEWQQLRKEEPDSFARAVAMSRNADIESPAVGLMHCNPQGKRQLHVWADGGYPALKPEEECETDTACECRT